MVGPARRLPLLMGILNLTPDSFSDGGLLNSTSAVIRRAEQMIAEGADIIDVGAESTRPGAEPLSVEEEWARLAPVLPALVALGHPLSIDTYKAEIMKWALSFGVDVINDVRGFSCEASCEAIQHVQQGYPCGLVMMHMRGTPATMQHQIAYDEFESELTSFFVQRLQVLQGYGVSLDRVILDPGIGFGKTLVHNLAAIRMAPDLADFQVDEQLVAGVLIGASRKSLIQAVTGVEDPARRLPGSLAIAIEAARLRATVLRVHDVAETKQALQMWYALQED